MHPFYLETFTLPGQGRDSRAKSTSTMPLLLHKNTTPRQVEWEKFEYLGAQERRGIGLGKKESIGIFIGRYWTRAGAGAGTGTPSVAFSVECLILIIG